MKRKSIIGILLCCMTMGMFTTSCEDMLSPDSERHSYIVAQDTLYSYWGILRSLQNVAERYIILNECRADLVDATSNVSDSIAAIINFGQGAYKDLYQDGSNIYLKASDYYHIINSCNAYIAYCDTFRTTGTQEKYMIKEYAQVQAIRAWVYMQLVYAYGKVPFYKEPLLTTDDINNFANNKNRPMVDASNLADYLAPELIPMEYVVEKYGYPQYETYGDDNYVCHSSKVMFPLSVVLGDLYLMKGDKASCAQAAQHYYNFLNSKYGGTIHATNYGSTGFLSEGEDDPRYEYANVPFTEAGQVSSNQEAITCIPSNKGKLDGKVNTSVNRLFGFTPTMSVSGNTESSHSSVGLTLNFDRELVASKGYEALCDSQKYEVYIGDSNNPYTAIAVLPGIGDARRSWTYDGRTGNQYIGYVGEDRMYGKFVSKQNPNRSFCATYPMVYRKATVWLRYAEAINRAGFPSYAFAVLKNGLCNNEYWYPDVDEDYGVKDTAYYWVNTVDSLDFDTIGYPHDIISTAAELSELVYKAYTDRGIDSADVAKNGKPGFEALGYHNYTQYYEKACYYLDKREVEKASVTPYMDYKQTYLYGTSSSRRHDYKVDVYNNRVNTAGAWPASAPTNNFYLTSGIHERGCGRLRYNEMSVTGLESSYNYVDMVAKKIKQNHGLDVTKEDIYGEGDTDISAYVEEAVEDLIIDEMGLELAFEGTRFADLARVAIRRNDPTFLAKRVAMRSGEQDKSLLNFLSNQNNWYLPLPNE